VETTGWQSGKVINLNTDKGFAFFKPENGAENVYIHKDLVARVGLVDGMSIEVEIEEYRDTKSHELKKLVKIIKPRYNE